MIGRLWVTRGGRRYQFFEKRGKMRIIVFIAFRMWKTTTLQVCGRNIMQFHIFILLLFLCKKRWSKIIFSCSRRKKQTINMCYDAIWPKCVRLRGPSEDIMWPVLVKAQSPIPCHTKITSLTIPTLCSDCSDSLAPMATVAQWLQDSMWQTDTIYHSGTGVCSCRTHGPQPLRGPSDHGDPEWLRGPSEYMISWSPDQVTTGHLVRWHGVSGPIDHRVFTYPGAQMTTVPSNCRVSNFDTELQIKSAKIKKMNLLRDGYFDFHFWGFTHNSFKTSLLKANWSK